MRKIELVEPKTRVWKKWRQDCEKALGELRERAQAGEALEFDADLYARKSIKAEYFFAKKAPFHGKCAYCEALIADFFFPDVEHWRPKGAVTDEYDQKILWLDDHGNVVFDEAGQPKPHPGYWWLAYEWTNLLPSCGICNRASKHAGSLGKRNRFPVRGRHAQCEAEIPNEEAILLHPGFDDPDLHFRIYLDGPFCGALVALDERGGVTLRVLGLNDRTQLVDGRKMAIESALYLVAQISTPDPHRSSEESERLRQRIREIREGKCAFTLAQLAVLRASGVLAFLEEMDLSPS